MCRYTAARSSRFADPSYLSPDDQANDDGDMIICDVTTRNGRKSEIVVEICNDGYFTWQVQE